MCNFKFYHGIFVIYVHVSWGVRVLKVRILDISCDADFLDDRTWRYISNTTDHPIFDALL